MTEHRLKRQSALDHFVATLSDERPPAGGGSALAALWWARRDAWEAAHALVQDEPGVDAAWVHAWLHRVEGDPGNAAYWYRRAGRPATVVTLDEEWHDIAVALLADNDVKKPAAKAGLTSQ